MVAYDFKSVKKYNIELFYVAPFCGAIIFKSYIIRKLYTKLFGLLTFISLRDFADFADKKLSSLIKVHCKSVIHSLKQASMH